MTSTPAAHLRPLRETDAEAVLDAFRSDPEGMSRQGDVVDEESARRYVQRFLDDPAMDAAAFADASTGHLLGLVTVIRDGVNRSGWFAYWAHPRARGRGLMTRAAPRRPQPPGPPIRATRPSPTVLARPAPPA